MFKLIKWIAIGTVATGATGYLLFGSHITSYIDTAATSIREGIYGKIPIDFELKRAEGLIKAIDPQLYDAKLQVAQAEVELENIQKHIVRLDREVKRGKHKLQHVSAGLQGDAGSVELAGYDRVRVQLDLERTFDAYRNNVALLRGKSALIERQTRAVAAAKSHLDAVLVERARLVDMVAALKTQKRSIDTLAASSTHINLDDSALGQAREVLNEIKTRLDVTQKMLEDDIFFSGPETNHASDRNVAIEIRKYFAENSGDDGVMVEVGEGLVEAR